MPVTFFICSRELSVDTNGRERTLGGVEVKRFALKTRAGRSKWTHGHATFYCCHVWVLQEQYIPGAKLILAQETISIRSQILRWCLFATTSTAFRAVLCHSRYFEMATLECLMKKIKFHFPSHDICIPCNKSRKSSLKYAAWVNIISAYICLERSTWRLDRPKL